MCLLIISESCVAMTSWAIVATCSWCNNIHSVGICLSWGRLIDQLKHKLLSQDICYCLYKQRSTYALPLRITQSCWSLQSVHKHCHVVYMFLMKYTSSKMLCLINYCQALCSDKLRKFPEMLLLSPAFATICHLMGKPLGSLVQHAFTCIHSYTNGRLD